MIFKPEWLYLPEYTLEEIRRCQELAEPGLFDTGLLVDANNVMYRLAFAASKDVSTPAEMLAVFVESVKGVVTNIGADLVICGIDFGVSLRRSMLGAKKKPDKTPEQEAVIALARVALKLLREANPHPWLNPAWMEGYEGDDIVSAFAVSNLCVHTVIYSTDSDLYQVTDGKGVTQLSPATDRFLVSEVPQALVPGVKALAGDTSDNIEGIYKVGVKTALAVLTGHKTLDLSAEDTLRVRNNLTLTTLPFPGAHAILEDAVYTRVPPMYEEDPPPEDDSGPLPF